VWHCSVSLGTPAAQRLKALTVLAGFGDSALGEWWEDGLIATHLRRRLSEEETCRVGPIKDIRGTSDAVAAFNAVRRYLPAHLTEIV
jgi:hypothetical protein